MTMHRDVAGIDVSQHRPDGFNAALARRWTGSACTVVFRGHRLLRRALRHGLEAAGVAYVPADPTRARDFARAAGFLTKTDAVDARMLAAMGAPSRPRAPPPPPSGELAGAGRSTGGQTGGGWQHRGTAW